MYFRDCPAFCDGRASQAKGDFEAEAVLKEVVILENLSDGCKFPPISSVFLGEEGCSAIN
jgi:hypothetical protein